MFIFTLDRCNGVHIVDYSYNHMIMSVCGKFSLKSERLNTFAADNVFDIKCRTCKEFYIKHFMKKNPRSLFKNSVNNRVKELYLPRHIHFPNEYWVKLLKFKSSVNRKFHSHK